MARKIEECSAVVEVADGITPKFIIGDILHANPELFNTEITAPASYTASYWATENPIEAEYTCTIESDYDDQTGVCDITILNEGWTKV